MHDCFAKVLEEIEEEKEEEDVGEEEQEEEEEPVSMVFVTIRLFETRARREKTMEFQECAGEPTKAVAISTSSRMGPPQMYSH